MSNLRADFLREAVKRLPPGPEGDTGHPEGLPCTALCGPGFSAAEAQRELGQRRGADVRFRG